MPGLQASMIPNRAIILPHRLVAKMQIERAGNLPKETGGFLIGARRGPHIEITDLTLQARKDIATTSSFERADNRHEASIGAAWREAEHRLSVIGDWHSHPFGNGNPSGADRSAWRTLSDANDADCVGLILASALLPRVFLVSRKSRQRNVVECVLVADESEDLVFGPKEGGLRRLI